MCLRPEWLYFASILLIRFADSLLPKLHTSPSPAPKSLMFTNAICEQKRARFYGNKLLLGDTFSIILPPLVSTFPCSFSALSSNPD
jgi:hypothetical protein